MFSTPTPCRPMPSIPVLGVWPGMHLNLNVRLALYLARSRTMVATLHQNVLVAVVGHNLGCQARAAEAAAVVVVLEPGAARVAQRRPLVLPRRLDVLRRLGGSRQ